MSPRPNARTSVRIGEDARVLVLGTTPAGTYARVVDADDEQLELAIATPLPTRVHDALILELDGRRVRGSVVAVQRDRLWMAVREVRAPDRREYPRFLAAVDVAWRVGSPLCADAWMAGRMAGGDDTRAPEPVEVSASGLGFVVDKPVEAGETLLLTLTLPGARRSVRCVGRVVRVDPVAAEAPRGRCNVGVSLVRAPESLTCALASLTLAAQDALLFGES